MKRRDLVCLAALFLWTGSAWATVLQVGSTKQYHSVSSAHDAAAAGDTIEIDSGTYIGDAAWLIVSKDNLTFRGVGATRPILDGSHNCFYQEGLFILRTSSTATTTIENLEIRNVNGGAGGNAAGVRGDSGNLTLRNCYIHGCDDGVLGCTGTVLFEYCEFGDNGYGDTGYTHNMYMSQAVTSFTLRYCYCHDTQDGHVVKTRAQANYILYNLLSSEQSHASRELQIANGGTAYVIGNVIQQGPNSNNGEILVYGDETNLGGANANPYLYVVNNTFINQRSSGGPYVKISTTTTTTLVQNNIFQGLGSEVLITGGTLTSPNWGNTAVTTDAKLVNIANHDYHLTSASTGAINLGTSPGTGYGGFSLTPIYQYKHPCNFEARPTSGAIDIGAYEYGTANQRPVVDAGTTQCVPVGGKANLVGTATDDGIPGALSTTWSLIAGPSGGTVTFGNASALRTTATFNKLGAYVLRLSATDTALTTTDTVTMLCDTPPSVTISADQTLSVSTLPTSTLVYVIASDPDNFPSSNLTYAWSQVSGPAAATFSDAAYSSTSAIFPAYGSYVLQAVVSDGGSPVTMTTNITVGPPVNTAPTVDAGSNQTITLPTSAVSLTGTASDDGIPAPLTYTWSQVSGPATVTFTPSNALSTTASGLTVAGSYVLKLTASDSALSSSDTVTITVNPKPDTPPTVDAGPNIAAIYENQTANLHATASDADNDPLTYSWSQTAGQAIASPIGTSTADYSFTTPTLSSRAGGAVTFSVTVNDGRGGSASDSVNMQVYIMGDINHDWSVNVGDLQSLVAVWNSGPGYSGPADLNGNGYVNIGDLQVLVASWGRALP